VRAGVLGAYPNMFFVVPETEIDAFSSAVVSLKSAADYERLVDSFGVRRSNENILVGLRRDQLDPPRERSRPLGDPGSHTLCD
jgi:hypothetical protein